MCKFSHRFLKVLILQLNILLLSGCLIIPTPEHGGEGVLFANENDFNKILKIGQTTRSDIILLWGTPSEMLENDRFQVYEWNRIHGYLFIGAMYAGYGTALTSNHYICLEFTPENRLNQFKLFDQYLGDDHKKLLEWIKTVQPLESKK